MIYTIRGFERKGQYHPKSNPDPEALIYVYVCTLVDENHGDMEENVEVGRIPKNPPKVGQEVEGYIEETEYGRKFHSTKTGSNAPRPTTPANAPRTTQTSFVDDSSQQSMIIRQSSLKAAVEYAGIKAANMSAEEVKEEITPQSILKTASIFAAWAEGRDAG